MGQLRTPKAADSAAFPGCTYVVDNTPPIAQCQETQISEVNVEYESGHFDLTIVGAFIGIDLAGKKITIGNTAFDNGTYNVISNTDDVLIMDHQTGADEDFATVDIHDAGQAYLTRNESSFQRFTENAGKAHTTKGGQLFVDVGAGPMAGACSDTFAPQ